MWKPSNYDVPGQSGFFEKVVGMYAIKIDFSKTFELVPQERPIMKLVASGVYSTVVIWVREFLVGHT